MKTLEEYIAYCEEVAEEQENKAKVLNGDFYQSRRNNCLECAEEHRQLAEWLKELKHWREFGENLGARLADNGYTMDDLDTIFGKVNSGVNADDN